MELVLSCLVGWLTACALYLMLRRDFIRFLLGFMILSNAVNLTLLLAGKLTRSMPPLIAASDSKLSLTAANPVPQALVLTAIVIGFGLLAFGLVLVYRVHARLGCTNPDRLAMPLEITEDFSI